jgi:glucan phosphoethanolaminetransferase (alkaline phosphatase superfamily)
MFISEFLFLALVLATLILLGVVAVSALRRRFRRAAQLLASLGALLLVYLVIVAVVGVARCQVSQQGFGFERNQTGQRFAGD